MFFEMRIFEKRKIAVLRHESFSIPMQVCMEIKSEHFVRKRKQ